MSGGNRGVPGLGKRVYNRRLELGLSKRELSRQTGIARQTLWRLEQGRTVHLYAYTVKALAVALRISSDALFGIEDPYGT